MTYYHDNAPTQYANRVGGSTENYCEYSLPADPEFDRIPESATETRSWSLPIMLAGLVSLTALVLTFVISTAVKFSDPVDATPSVVVTHPVEPVPTGNVAPQSSAQPTAVAPTNATREPVTVTRSPEPPPATMTNPLEPAPATMTNPLEPAPLTMTNPVRPPLTMTNPVRPPLTMTNPVEPAPATMTNPLEPPPLTMTNPVEPPLIGSSGSGE